MNRQTSTWGISNYRVRPEERWLELLCILGLFLAAIILYSLNLGSLPLRDWDEGTVVQVAKEIYQAEPHQLKWLFPTIWGEPYLNKPPLIHSLIALVYSIFGINEFTSRIVGASLTAISVPLLYCLGREIFLPRYYALFSALVYLTMLPVVRHGRLAMLDGAILCFEIFMIWCLLRSRRDLRWTLGAGIGFCLICLSKGWMMGILLGAIAFIFIIWDTPRLLTSIYLWFGIALGAFPVILWQVSQWLKYEDTFLNTSVFEQSLNRISTSVEGHSGPIWYYLIELLKYPHPWIFLSLFGLKYAWNHRNWGWGKLILIWNALYLVVVSIMMTKLPWYILPIYPAIALAAGVALAEIKSLPDNKSFPRSWISFFAILGLIIITGIAYLILFNQMDYGLIVILGLISLTMIITSIMISKRDEQFIIILIWGMYVALLLFFSSDYWLWELNEAFPVKPVASLIQNNVPVTSKIYTTFDYERPSLNFYSERRVIPLNSIVGEENNKHWTNIKEFWQDETNTNYYILFNKKTDQKILNELTFTELNCQNKSDNKDYVESEEQPEELNSSSSTNLNINNNNDCFISEEPSEWLLLEKNNY